MSWMTLIGRSEDAALERLLDTFARCHQGSAMRNQNMSSVALQIAASSGATMAHSVASSLLTLGDKHGPADLARIAIYDRSTESIEASVENGEKVCGWGNSFYKTSVDPSFLDLAHLVREEYPDHEEKLKRVSEIIFKSSGKALYPNPAAYTAVCAEILNLPRGSEIMLFILARVPAWSALWVQCAGGTR